MTPCNGAPRARGRPPNESTRPAGSTVQRSAAVPGAPAHQRATKLPKQFHYRTINSPVFHSRRTVLKGMTASSRIERSHAPEHAHTRPGRAARCAPAARRSDGPRVVTGVCVCLLGGSPPRRRRASPLRDPPAPVFVSLKTRRTAPHAFVTSRFPHLALAARSDSGRAPISAKFCKYNVVSWCWQACHCVLRYAVLGHLSGGS